MFLNFVARFIGQKNVHTTHHEFHLEILEPRVMLSNYSLPADLAFDLSHDHQFPREPQELIDRDLAREAAATAGEGEVAESLAPLTDTFLLHSLPGANHTIYLDFDGHVTSGTTWNGGATINSPAYDIDGNASSFSTTELQRIQRIWQRVAEDFAPFEVNVTTEEPGTAALSKSGTGDVAWGTRVVVTDDTWANCGCGGHAYIGSFNDSLDEPVFVYNTSEIGVSAAASHEVGHALYLSHDGLSSGTTYYNGHGANGTEEEWGPIMGSGYYTNMTTWDNGTYYDSNNGTSSANYNRGPDDLQVITTYNGFGFRTDDYGGTTGSASALGIVGPNGSDPTLQDVDSFGIITQPGDVDMFSFTTGAGLVNLTIDSYVAETHVSQGGGNYTVSYEGTPINNQGSNLDVLATIYNSGGGVVATSSPSGLSASFNNLNLAAGTYYVGVDGTGFGDWTANPPTGYDNYVSLGQYRVTGTIVATNPTNNSPTANNDSSTVDEDGSVNINVLGNDTDPDSDPLSVTSATQGSSGSVVIENDDTVTYTPNANFNGSDSFTYTVSDGRGGVDTGTVNVAVAPVPDISIAAVSADKLEGDSGVTAFTFEISLDEAAASTVSVHWEVDDGGDVDAADFGGVLPAGDVSFAPGQPTSQQITVNVSGDTDVEIDELFSVSLSSPVGGDLGTSLAGGTIRNDDIPPTYTYTDFASSETTTHGTADGLISTFAEDGNSETVTESLYQRNKRSRLEHTWNFDVTGGDVGMTFELIAGHNSSAESFEFAYNNNDGLGWQTILTLNSAAQTSYSVALPTTVSGAVSIRVTDTDRRQNENVADSVFVDYMAIVSETTVQNDQPPTVTVTNPSNGSDVSGSVTVTANASDDDAVTQVEFFVNGTSIGVDTNGGDGWSASWNTTSYGEDAQHTVSATATDSASQTSSNSVTATVDNTDNAPTVSITEPNDGDTVSGAVVITANAADDRGVNQVEFFVNGSSIGVDSDGSDGWSVNWDTTGLPNGSAHTIDATVTDSGGNTSDATRVNVTVDQVAQLSITSISPSTTAPDSSVIVTITGTGFVNGASVILENGSGPTPTVSNVSIVDANTITATITTHRKAKAVAWDVRVTNPDSTTAVLIDGITVTTGAATIAPAATEPGENGSTNGATALIFAPFEDSVIEVQDARRFFEGPANDATSRHNIVTRHSAYLPADTTNMPQGVMNILYLADRDSTDDSVLEEAVSKLPSDLSIESAFVDIEELDLM